MLPSAIAALVSGCGQSDTSDERASALAADDTTASPSPTRSASDTDASVPLSAGGLMNVHYLEIVTPEVDALCAQYEAVHGISFSEPVASLGNARTATIDGGMIGVRGPMHDQETPVVRPYVLVDDIQAAVDAAAAAGAMVALPPMPIPDYGTCAIVIHGGIDCGFWQV